MESLISLILILTSTTSCLMIGGGEVGEYDLAVASWYGSFHYGKLTANGEIFNDKDLTFAHKTIKFGTLVRFYYKGKTVIARCNDRGPFIKGREFDLSYQTAKRLDLLEVGVDYVFWKIIKEIKIEKQSMHKMWNKKIYK